MNQKMTISYRKDCSEIFLSRLQYTIEAINGHEICQAYGIIFELSIDIGDIRYGDGKGTFRVPCQNEIFEDSNQELFINEYGFQQGKLYGVGSGRKTKLDFYKNNTFAFDIFETIFFHLSRYEERFTKQSDYLGRKVIFENQLLLVKNGLEKIPVVDKLIKAFLEILTQRKIIVRFPTSLSHDIDYIQKYKSPWTIIRKIAGHIKHQKPANTLPKLFKSYREYLFQGRDPFDTFEWMLSKKSMVKSIYFLVGGEHKEDNQYKLNNPIFQKALEIARERKYRIGIHPSYESWNDVNLIMEQKHKLEKEVEDEIVISRQHFLNFDIEITPRLLQNIGIKEDSSLGYTRYIGYRCGTGFPYKLYDFENENAFDVLERPLIFMDTAYWYEKNRQEDNNDLDIQNLFGDFNFHNSSFDELLLSGFDHHGIYKEMFI